MMAADVDPQCVRLLGSPLQAKLAASGNPA